jgi:peroxiredoxin
MKRVLPIVWIALLCPLAAGQSEAQSKDEKEIPTEKIQRLARLTELPATRGTAKELLELYEQQLHNAMSMALRLERDYPEAPNLHRVRMFMIHIAEALDVQFKDPGAGKVRLAIAQRLAGSKVAPVESRYQADVILLEDRTASMVTEDLRTALLQFVARYLGTKRELRAKLHAFQQAGNKGADHLYRNLRQDLMENHLDQADVRAVLRAMGEHPDVGRVLEATLTKLDGKKIQLPKDTRGKVVVLDFWSTRVPNAEVFARRVRKVHEAHKDRPLVVIGINLDDKGQKDAVMKFIRKHNLGWPQTFSGLGLMDPTALKTGLVAREEPVAGVIPNWWVIGKDGKVISDQAFSAEAEASKLDALVKKALAQPTPAPQELDATSAEAEEDKQ